MGLNIVIGLIHIVIGVSELLIKGEWYLFTNSKVTAVSSPPHVEQQPIASTPAAFMRVEDVWARMTVTEDLTQQQAQEVFYK